MELTSPANPGSLPPSSRVYLQCHGGRTQVSSGRINPEGSRFTISHTLAATRIPGSYKPLYSVRLPALKQINFKLSPVPYWGNVVARVNYSERLQRNTNAFYIKPPTPSSFMSNFICPKTTLETFQWSRDYSKVFVNIFEIFPKSVPILEFLAPLGVSYFILSNDLLNHERRRMP
jgi:hypothetical protein